MEQLFNIILGYIHTTQPIQNYYLKHFFQIVKSHISKYG